LFLCSGERPGCGTTRRLPGIRHDRTTLARRESTKLRSRSPNTCHICSPSLPVHTSNDRGSGADSGSSPRPRRCPRRILQTTHVPRGVEKDRSLVLCQPYCRCSHKMRAGGVQACQLGATTAGDSLFYAASGQLLFPGGITGSRCHSGDNAGRGAVESLLLNDNSGQQRRALAFGCPLPGRMKTAERSARHEDSAHTHTHIKCLDSDTSQRAGDLYREDCLEIFNVLTGCLRD